MLARKILLCVDPGADLSPAPETVGIAEFLLSHLNSGDSVPHFARDVGLFTAISWDQMTNLIPNPPAPEISHLDMSMWLSEMPDEL